MDFRADAFLLMKLWVLPSWRQLFVAPTARIAKQLVRASQKLKRISMGAIRVGLQRIWIFEAISSSLLLVAFFCLWNHLQTNPTILKELSGFPSALISILAITNAISLLGANTYLARYSAFDKINEIFSSISRITTDNYERLNGHPRDNKFARRKFYSWLGNRSSISEVNLSSSNEPYFTPRPYWDGVWFFGSDTYNRTRQCDLGTFLSFHELLISAVFVLRFVLTLRDERVALIISKKSAPGLKDRYGF